MPGPAALGDEGVHLRFERLLGKPREIARIARQNASGRVRGLFAETLQQAGRGHHDQLVELARSGLALEIARQRVHEGVFGPRVKVGGFRRAAPAGGGVKPAAAFAALAARGRVVVLAGLDRGKRGFALAAAPEQQGATAVEYRDPDRFVVQASHDRSPGSMSYNARFSVRSVCGNFACSRDWSPVRVRR